MSGLEIVAGVAAIVSAFNGSVTLFRSWRDKRKERLEKTQNRDLDRSLTVGGTTVQREYDGHFARLGQAFAVGDDRSRAELAGYVIKLQHIIITMMTESNSSTGLLLPSLPTIYSTSEDTRTGVVSALTEQYQRMMQARPLSISHSLNAPVQPATSNTLYPNFPSRLKMCRHKRKISGYMISIKYNPKSGVDRVAKCPCGFRNDFRSNEPLWLNSLYVFAIMREVFKYHYQPPSRNGATGQRLLYCSICSISGIIYQVFTGSEMLDHLGSHRFDELAGKGFVAQSQVGADVSLCS